MPEPDLTAELDAAEDVVMGRAESVVTEWGVRHDDLGGTVAILGPGPGSERHARREAACWPLTAALVRRTVTYGPWETAPSVPAGTTETENDSAATVALGED